MSSHLGPFRPPVTDTPFRAANEVGKVAFALHDQSSNTRNVEVQLQDVNGNNLSQVGSVNAYLSDDADGSTLTATAPSTGIAIGTDGLLIAGVANKAFRLVSESNGHIDLTITSTAHTWYLVVVLPTGTIMVSDAIAMT